MLTLQLDAPADSFISEPVDYLRSNGKSLYAEPGNRLVARHEMGLWQTEQRSFMTLTIATPVVVCFDNPETGHVAQYGPLEQLRLEDGFMRAGRKFDQMIGHFSDFQQDWRLMGESQNMRNVVIRPAAEE